MKSWVSYIGAFALGLGAAVLVYMSAFSTIMTGAGYGIAGFVLLAVFCPILAGVIVFGVGYGAFAGHWLTAAQWITALGITLLVAFASFLLLAQGILQDLPALLLMLVMLFIGGRYLLKRASLV